VKSDFKPNRQAERHPQTFRVLLAVLLILVTGVPSLHAQTTQPAPQTRLVVRDSLGLSNLLNLCSLIHCSGVLSLGDPQGQLFMIQIPSGLAPLTSLLNLSILGLITIETDQTVQTQGATVTGIPSYLTDKTPYSYYGATVWHGYVFQPDSNA